MPLTAHAYIARGGPETLERILVLLEKTGVDIKANPDLMVTTYSSFTMDDARALREKASLRALGKDGRMFVLAMPTLAPDVQNALLKTFEEPPAGARFFVAVPSPETLLPTLLSRVQTLDVPGAAVESLIDAAVFLKAAPEKRVEMLKPLLEKGDDDKRDLSGTLSFLAALEKLLGQKPEANERGLKSVYRARKYITDRGALAKALLEQLALLI